MAEQKEKTSLYLLSIVGIVAVVGIVLLVLNVGKASMSVSGEETLAGEAISSFKPTIGKLTIGKPDLKVDGFTSEYDGDEFRIYFDVINNGKKKISAGTSFDVDVNVDFYGVNDYGTTDCIASTYSDSTTVTITLDSDLGAGETVSDAALLTTDPRLVEKLETGEMVDGFWTNTVITVDTGSDVSESDETNNGYESYMAVTT